MAAKKIKTPAYVSPPGPPARVRRDVAEPAWYKERDRSFGHLFTQSVRAVLAKDAVWTLPPFQRDVVWGAEKQVGFCNTVVQGLPTATVLVWRRYLPDGDSPGKHKHVSLVLDGQQRLTAMGALVERSPGGPRNPLPQAYFDPATARFTTDPGRWGLTMRDVVTHDVFDHMVRLDELEGTDPEGYDLWDHLIYARDMVGDKLLSFFVIEERATPEFVVDAFRAINRPGVPFDEVEVERLVASARDFGVLG